MASGSLIHLAVFASGAVLGAGAFAAVNSRSKYRHATDIAAAAPTGHKPIDSEGGALHGALDVTNISNWPSAVLKFGNPGQFDLYVHRQHLL
jgi:hypothetical protein